MKAKDIQRALYASLRHHPITIEEKHDFLNQYCDADFVAITASGQAYEYEIKVSHADFLRDFKKRRFKIYNGEIEGQKPNRFWYVTPPGLIREGLPEWAGLIEIETLGPVEVMKAPLLWRGTIPLKSILQCAHAMKRRIAYKYATNPDLAKSA